MFRAILAILCGLPLLLNAAPRQPAQPKDGPGGSKAAHASIRESEHGAGATRYWLFEPAEPAPKKAPLVIFLHGYSATNPDPYRAWISHIVKRGAIVVYPQYQKDLFTPPVEYFQNSATSIRSALEVLAEDGHVKPDLARVAVVGHSAGGVGSANYAAHAVEEKLPLPKAIMTVHAGQGPEKGLQIIPLEELDTVPESVKVVVVAGQEDQFVGMRSSRRIWQGTKHVKERVFITVQSDTHGMPRLVSGHLAPLARDMIAANTLDYLGYWRLFDELCDAAFSGKPFAPSPSLGEWSDGTPVKPLLIER
jgi:poly(3-hydroxybutyrate) depolymerase